MNNELIIFLPLLLLFPLLWFFRKPVSENNSDQREAENVAVFHEAKSRLENQLAAGEIDEETWQQLHTELARDLIDARQEGLQQSQSQQGLLFYVLFVVIIALTVAIYWRLGAIQDIRISSQLENMMSLPAEQRVEAYKALLPGIEQRFSQRPEKSAYGFLLAQNRMQQGDYQQAAIAYQNILDNFPEDERILALFAQARFLANDRKLDAEATQAVQKALMLNPDEKTALGLMGMASFENRQWQPAVDYWQRLLRTMPPGSPGAEMITNGIRKAQENLGLDPDKQLVTEPLITAKVYFAEGLVFAPATPVFIAVRDVSRGMPIAARKLPFYEFPRHVSFSDADSLMPQRLLSSMKQVEIIARVSLSGEPVAQPGDYQSKAVTLDIGKQAVELELQIDQLVE